MHNLIVWARIHPSLHHFPKSHQSNCQREPEEDTDKCKTNVYFSWQSHGGPTFQASLQLEHLPRAGHGAAYTGTARNCDLLQKWLQSPKERGWNIGQPQYCLKKSVRKTKWKENVRKTKWKGLKRMKKDSRIICVQDASPVLLPDFCFGSCTSQGCLFRDRFYLKFLQCCV